MTNVDGSESAPAEGWRVVTTLEEPNLVQVIGERLAANWTVQSETLASLRASTTLLLFSDYSGTHKGAPYEVYSFLVTTPVALSPFLKAAEALRGGALGMTRRMSYKALNDAVRSRALPGFLDAADQLQGLVISFAIDKQSAHRLSEAHQQAGAFGTIRSWSPRAFRKLTTIGNLAGTLLEGVRGEHQDLMWFTDEDDIAPNEPKHAEATRLLGHYLSAYLSGPMGHLRFGTSASDPGDLSIEDALAIPDLVAGCLGEVLNYMKPNLEGSSFERLFVPEAGHPRAKVRQLTAWLAADEARLQKMNVVVDEGPNGCGVRTLTLVTGLDRL